MSIDDIKRTGGFGQVNYPSADTPGESKPGQNFADVRSDVQSGVQSGTPEGDVRSAGAGTSSTAAAAKLTRSDLQDPAKLNQAVKDTASELVESQTSGTSLSADDKRALADYMSDDPVLRQNIETYLRKAVS